MSADPKVSKLEALLARITSRAAAPRVVVAAPAVAPVAPLPAPPPPPVVVEPEIIDESVDVTIDMPVDVSRDVVEIPVAAKSDARLIAVKAVEPEAIDAEPSDTLLGTGPELIEEVAADDISADVVEEEESAPSSSRRPISPPAEEIAQTAFGAEDLAEPPRHTPPPESGRLPAAPDLAPVVDSGEDSAQEITGVHHTAAGDRAVAVAPAAVDEADVLARSGEHEGVSLTDDATPALAGPPQSALTPHVARPVVEASAPVVDAIGAAMAFSPATFGELLDATLGF